MKKKFLIFGICSIAVVLLGAVAVETVGWVQKNRVVRTTSDIFSAYLDARESLPPLPLPMEADDLLGRMEADDFSFLNDHWFVDQAGSVLYAQTGSKLAKTLKLPIQILVVEDLYRGEVTIYCEDKKGDWKGLALFDAPPILDETDTFYATLSAKEKEKDLFLNLSATRIRWTVTLKPETEMLTDFLFQRDAAVASLSLPEEGGMMAMRSVPPEHTNDIWISGESGSSGLELEVYCPSGVTNVELYTTTDLISNVWTVAVENLFAIYTNRVYWTMPAEEDRGFVVAGNGGLDTDGDLLCDARETIVHKTDPALWDTDGDGINDGDDLARGTDPLVFDDADGDEVGDGVEEFQNATNPQDRFD